MSSFRDETTLHLTVIYIRYHARIWATYFKKCPLFSSNYTSMFPLDKANTLISELIYVLAQVSIDVFEGNYVKLVLPNIEKS